MALNATFNNISVYSNIKITNVRAKITVIFKTDCNLMLLPPPFRLAAILAIMSLSTFKSADILYVKINLIKTNQILNLTTYKYTNTGLDLKKLIYIPVCNKQYF
jgi:hypothetical protein